MTCSLTQAFPSKMIHLHRHFLLEYSSFFLYYALDAALQFGLHWLPFKPLASLNKCLVSPSYILEVIYLNIIDLMPSILIYKLSSMEWNRGGVDRSWVELLRNRGVWQQNGEQPWPQLICYALIYCCIVTLLENFLQKCSMGYTLYPWISLLEPTLETSYKPQT